MIKQLNMCQNMKKLQISSILSSIFYLMYDTLLLIKYCFRYLMTYLLINSKVYFFISLFNFLSFMLDYKCSNNIIFFHVSNHSVNVEQYTEYLVEFPDI